MRSFYKIPTEVLDQTYINQLMAAGYQVSAKYKQDFQFRAASLEEAQREISRQDWGEIPQDKPFFIVRNYAESHESPRLPE